MPEAVTRAAARSLDKPRACDVSGIELTDDAMQVATSPDIDVVVELIGGTAQARELHKGARPLQVSGGGALYPEIPLRGRVLPAA